VEHQHELESGVGVGSRRARGNSFIPDGRHFRTSNRASCGGSCYKNGIRIRGTLTQIVQIGSIAPLPKFRKGGKNFHRHDSVLCIVHSDVGRNEGQVDGVDIEGRCFYSSWSKNHEDARAILTDSVLFGFLRTADLGQQYDTVSRVGGN
jgi:hypothetical protein